MSKPTIVWGVCADDFGLVHRTWLSREDLPGGQMRAWKREEFVLDPADAYVQRHPAPMPMLWSHDEEIGNIVALRRAHGRLYAVGETKLEPDDLQALTDDHGELKWSTGTNRRAPFTIGEISLTPNPASVGLWPVRWLVPGSGRGSLPQWVQEDLSRKVETRSRELIVHEPQPTRSTSGDSYADLERYFRLHQGEIFHSGGVGQILAVNGRPVRR